MRAADRAPLPRGFLLGIGVGVLPYGRPVGEALGALDRMWLVLAIAGLLGLLVRARPAERHRCNES
ncbi:DUF1538 domain-containing protein [Rhodoplanes serenus]|uniref:DUF1538 domain-containing protein n=1 Tax=Rhodoplanes serenus TaxID=200615 RepID=A0A9X4XRQ0_9BRAD|nr:DUF1538 domain-containing protein [Rhodoplanes serenus]